MGEERVGHCGGAAYFAEPRYAALDVRTPWHRDPPPAAVEVATDDDEYLTVDKWPRSVFAPHWHEEFNWIVLTRPGRVVALRGRIRGHTPAAAGPGGTGPGATWV